MIRPLVALLSLLALTAPPLTTMAQAEPVARVGKWVLDLSEVDKDLAQKLYELREEKMQELVIEHLLELEAKANGVAVDQVLEKMVDGKLPALSDRDVQEFIEANRARLPKGEGLEEKVREYLQDKIKQNLQAAYLQSLTEKYEVDFMMTPPRYTVPGPLTPSKGKADAPITIIEFSDFECPYCRRAQEAINKVEKNYGDKVRFVFRHYPLPFHKKAPKASEAAQCADDQNAFWPFHHALFADDAKLEIAAFKKLAKELKLNMSQFNSCLDSGKYAQRIADDLADGKGLGITGTPTFFINGIKLVGAVPFADFAEVIESELAQ
ncbi:MAG: DsbA family protein [Magnetococcales bacterium]|nr:DsbA family protein [Magnetococcales bacterium]